MDKTKMEAMCVQILDAVNAVEVRGERSMMQLLGIARNARSILIELGSAEKEAEDNGRETHQ